MARGRMLNQRIAEDIDFNAMSIEAQFIFMRTIPFLDRDGLIVGHPALLWSKVAPLLPDFVTQMESIIGEWVDAGFVVRYTEGKAPYLFFPSFSKNQVGLRYDREPASELPTPPGYYRNGNGLEPIKSQPPDADGGEAQPVQMPDDNPPQTSGNHPADFRQSSGNLPPEVNRIEVEVNTRTRATTPPEHRQPTTTADPSTGRFVQEYERVWGLTLNAYHAEKVAEWAGRVTFEGWSYGLQECADTRNVGKWKYLESILRRVEVEGVTATEATAAGVVNINLTAV